jgi:hypothetical protein
MDDGWTMKPSSPVGTETGEHLEPFEIEINSSRAQVNGEPHSFLKNNA